jgi:hypothetical protein
LFVIDGEISDLYATQTKVCLSGIKITDTTTKKTFVGFHEGACDDTPTGMESNKGRLHNAGGKICQLPNPRPRQLKSASHVTEQTGLGSQGFVTANSSTTDDGMH